VTIVDPISVFARSRPNSMAIGDAESGAVFNYAAFNDAINLVAAHLVGALGAASGERVATLARNDVNMVILHFACFRASAILVPFNWRSASADVAQCAVIGLPDAKWGEVGKVFAISRPVAYINAWQVVAHDSARFARFKVPVFVVITDAISRTASGKVQKHLLKNDSE
jgi:acyl-CoA synthetase (AMP-forming)/AMP-acid ligase II